MLTTPPKTLGVDNSSQVVALRMEAPEGGWADAYGQFDGTEALRCELWMGDDGPVVATPPVRWWVADDGSSFNANEPSVEVDFPKEAMDLLSVGRWLGRVLVLPEGENPWVVALFRVPVVSGPDADSPTPRLAYHTYKQLLDIAPWVEQLDDDFHDRLGFAELASQARDWIDSEILTSARYQPCNRYGVTSTTYGDALTADRLDLTTLGGRLLSQASANYTLSLIAERAISAEKTPGGALDPEVYMRRAVALRTKACADFTGTGDSALRSVPLAYIPWGRVSR